MFQLNVIRMCASLFYAFIVEVLGKSCLCYCFADKWLSTRPDKLQRHATGLADKAVVVIELKH